MVNSDNVEQQVDKLVKYLTGLPIRNQKIYTIYESAMEGNVLAKDRLTQMALRHTWLIPFFDSALVFLRPYADLRKRIYVTFAILESMPEYSNEFLPSKAGFWELLHVVGSGLRAIFRALIGIIIIKVGHI